MQQEIALRALKAGGIIPSNVDVKTDLPVESVDARVYTHPLLGGRNLIRLTQSSLAKGEDVKMEYFGAEQVEVHEDVGKTVREALGFPESMMIAYPKEASEAMKLSFELDAAMKNAASKPGNAKVAVDEIAGKLEKKRAHFIPSFYEEAGRRFIHLDNARSASACFTDARRAEQTYGLEVDEEIRTSAMVEFAIAGAVSNQAMKDWSRDLQERYGDEHAFEAFFDLAVRRTLGGSSVQSTLATEFRRLARAAKRNVMDEEVRFLMQVYEAPSFARSAAGFFKTFKKGLIAAAKDLKFRGRLLNLFPTPESHSSSFAALWMEILDEAKALEALFVDEDKVDPLLAPRPDRGGWLERFLHADFGGSYWNPADPLPDSFIALLKKLAPIFKKEEIAIGMSSVVERRTYDLDIVDVMLELGYRFEIKPEECSVRVRSWLKDTDSQERPRDLSYILADDSFRGLVESDLDDWTIQGSEFQSTLRQRPGSRAMLRIWSKRATSSVDRWAVPSFMWAANRFPSSMPADVVHLEPTLRQAIDPVDPVQCLMRTLQGGLIDELYWEAFEEAAEELGEATVYSYFPYVVLANKARAIVLGAQGRVLEHDLRTKDHINSMVYSGGQLFVGFRDSSWTYKGYWSSNPKKVFDHDSVYLYKTSHTVALEDGRIFTDNGPLTPGDEIGTRWKYQHYHDGTSVWRSHEGKFSKFDPKSNAFVSEDPPEFLRQTHQEGWTGVLFPAPDNSVLGARDGLYGAMQRWHDGQYEFKSLDGQITTIPRSADALITIPGAEEPVCFSDWQLFGRNGDWISAGTWVDSMTALSPYFLHYFSPRDLALSTKLRQLTRPEVERLLAAAILDHKDPLEETLASYLEGNTFKAKDNRVTAVLEELVGKKTDPKLSKVIGWHLESFVNHLFRWEQWKAALDGTATQVAGLPDDSLSQAFEALSGNRVFDLQIGNSWARPQTERPGIADVVLQRGVSFLQGEEPQAQASGDTPWHTILSQPAWVILGMALPSVRDEHRRTIASALPLVVEALRDLNREELRHHYLAEASEDVFTGDRGTFYLEEGKSRYWCTKISGYGASSVAILEYGKKARDLPSTFGRGVHPMPVSTWGNAADLQEIIDAVEDIEDMGVPVEKEAIEKLAEISKLSYPEAALLYCGLPEHHSWSKNFMPKELREAAGLKVKEASAARDAMRSRDDKELLRVVLLAAERAGASLFGEDRAMAWANALAEAFVEVFGRTQSVDLELLELLQHKDALEAFNAVVGDGESNKWSQASQNEVGFYSYWNEPTLTTVVTQEGFYTSELELAMMAISRWSWALSVGHPVRQNLAPFYRKARSFLQDERLIFPLGYLDNYWELEDAAIEAICAQVGGEKKTLSTKEEGKTHSAHYYDNGLMLAIPGQRGQPLSFRPAYWLRGETHPLYEADQSTLKRNFETFVSEDFAAFADRIEDTPVPEGQWEQNPAHSVPELVAEVEKALEVSTDSAIVYLQTLALWDPTTANLRLWNDWKPKQYNDALAPLAERKLLIEARRARAGRKHFLPGGWNALKAPHMPIENWKEFLYPFRNEHIYTPVLTAIAPPHILFTRAWEKVSRGEGP